MEHTFNCAFCEKDAEYLDFNENIIVCEEHNKNQKSVKIDFESEMLISKKLKYIKINSYFIFISGFETINSELIKILSYLNKNPYNAKRYLYFFPNKKQSNNFGKEFFDKDYDFPEQSKFTRVLTPDNNQRILFNFEKIKSEEEIMFLIELTKIQVKSFAEIDNYRNIFYGKLFNLRKEYNSRFGVEFVSKPEKEEFNNLDLLFNIDLNLFQEYTNYNHLTSNFENQTYFYILDYLDRIYLPAFKGNMEKPYHLDQFIWTLHQLIIPAIFLALKFPNEKCKVISERINLIWSKDIWTKEVFPLQQYYKSYLDYLENKLKTYRYKNIKEFSDMIYDLNLNLLKIIPKYLSIPELRIYWKKGSQISEKLQLFSKDYKLILPEITDFMNFTSKVIDENFLNQHIMIFLHERYSIWQSLSIITKKKEYYKQAILAYDELIKKQKEIGQKVHDEVEMGENYSYNEQIMEKISLGYLYFNFGENEKYKNTMFDLKKYLEDDKVDEFTKLTITSLLFFTFEDYDSLKELYRYFANYKHDKSIYSRLDKNRNKSIKYFAEAFYTNDIIEKEKLYLKAIDENEVSEVMLGSLGKDITERNVFRALYKMYIFLEKALFEDNIYLINTNLENALEVSKSVVKEDIVYETTYYQMLKCDIALLFLKNDFNNIKKNIEELRKFNFESSNKFIEIIEKITDFELNNNSDEIDKLFYLIEKKENNDIWIKIIQKIYTNKLQTSFLENKLDIQKIQNMNDMDFLMKEFLNIVEVGCVKAFWKNSKKIKQSNPEEIGRSLLFTFLNSLNKFQLSKEAEINFYKTDLLANKNGDCYLFETKIYYDKKNYEDGFFQIKKKYYDYLKNDNYNKVSPYYIVFDDRKKKVDLPKEVVFEDIKIKVIQIHIGKLF